MELNQKLIASVEQVVKPKASLNQQPKTNNQTRTGGAPSWKTY